MKYYRENELPEPIERRKFASQQRKERNGIKVLYPISFTECKGHRKYSYLMQCSCGQYFSSTKVLNNCGLCQHKLIGKKYNHLTIIKVLPPYVERPYSTNSLYVECECDCDNKTIIRTGLYNLKDNNVKSCGCLKRKVPLIDKKGYKIDHRAGIYRFENCFNGKSYIGKAKDIHKRYLEHKEYKSSTEYLNDKQLYQAFDKYGFENFNFYIEVAFDEIPKPEILSKLEEEYIIKYDSYKNGYNASLNSSGGFYSKEHEEKCCKILEELNKKQKGVNHPRTNLTEEIIKKVFDYGMKGAPSHWVYDNIPELKENYKNYHSFQQLYAGKQFQNLIPDGYENRPKVYSSSKLWGKDVQDIRKRAKNNEKLKDIYNLYKDKICYNGLLDIVNNKSYKNIQ